MLPCHECRQCCRFTEPTIILTADEAARFPVVDVEGQPHLPVKDGLCIFYDALTGRCQTYDRRPEHCQSYPAFPYGPQVLLDGGCPHWLDVSAKTVDHAVTFFRTAPPTWKDALTDKYDGQEALRVTLLSPDVRLYVYFSVKRIEREWHEFHGDSPEMVADFTLATLLESLITTPYLVYVFRAATDGRVVGILPMTQVEGEWDYAFSPWLMSPRFPVLPEFLSSVMPRLPRPFILTDNSFQYGTPTGTGEFVAHIVRLPKTFDDYRQTMRAKSRKAFKFLLRDNADLCVTVGWDDALWALQDRCVEQWRARGTDEGAWVALQRQGFHRLYPRALETRRLFPLIVWHGDTPIAAAMNVREGNTLLLYEVYRPTDDVWRTRGVGNFAVLKSIEWAISQGFHYYDLARAVDPSMPQEYKQRFVNTEHKMPLVMSVNEYQTDSLAPYWVKGELWNPVVVGEL